MQQRTEPTMQRRSACGRRATPQHADAKSLVQTNISVPRRQLTTRALSQRRGQQLRELTQQQAKQLASQEATRVPASSPIKNGAAPSHARSSAIAPD
jgi:hypothetical protein